MGNKFKIPFIFIFSFLLLIYLIGSVVFTKKTFEREFYKFYDSNVYGRLSYVGIKEKGVELKVNNVSYVFYPIYDDSLNSLTFSPYLADKGDTIRKKIRSDTLFLYKNGKIFKYIFKKS